jgi:hypothetical protein
VVNESRRCRCVGPFAREEVLVESLRNPTEKNKDGKVDRTTGESDHKPWKPRMRATKVAVK